MQREGFLRCIGPQGEAVGNRRTNFFGIHGIVLVWQQVKVFMLGIVEHEARPKDGYEVRDVYVSSSS
ncbi:MAG: hypothetical protein O2780_15350 [Proteobacteria bacterium]|nr:hypothetical protein [Pseudomonadota bacterium]MDA1299664.1 hypothetical protein [Pseudomonadota bacterium]